MAISNSTSLPKLISGMPIVNSDFTPSMNFLRFWQIYSTALQNEIGALETATQADLNASNAIVQIIQAGGSSSQAYILANEALGLLSNGSVYTVSTLPTANAGQRAFVSDATSTTFLSAVVGGGSHQVPVVANSSTWLIG